MQEYQLGLETEYKLISMEAISIGETLGALPKRLPGFVANVKSFIGNTLGGGADGLSSFSADRKLQRAIKQVNFTSLAKQYAYVPAGMKCTFNDYINALSIGQSMAEKLMDDVLKPAKFFIATLLSEPERLSRISGSTEFRNIKFHDLDKYKKAITACISDTQANDRAEFGAVIESRADWATVEDKALKLQETHAGIDRGALVDMVSEITGSLDTLMQRAEDDPDEYRIGGKAMKELADLAYKVAQEVEFYSVYSFQLQQLLQALTDTQEMLRKSVNV